MNSICRIDVDEKLRTVRLPAATLFVDRLVARVDNAYPSTVLSITKAMGREAQYAPLLVSFMRNRLTRSAFLIGCAAEEIASATSLIKKQDELQFVREVVEALRSPAKPLPAKQIGPALRRLIKEFKQQPTQTRTGMVRYMLQLNQLEELAEKMAADPVMRLAIECTVATDGVAGLLWEALETQAESNARRLPPSASRSLLQL